MLRIMEYSEHGVSPEIHRDVWPRVYSLTHRSNWLRQAAKAGAAVLHQ
jgi:hypothetical protein